MDRSLPATSPRSSTSTTAAKRTSSSRMSIDNDSSKRREVSSEQEDAKDTLRKARQGSKETLRGKEGDGDARDKDKEREKDQKETMGLAETQYIDQLQKACTCVICQDLLAEPYTFVCGHVYCYTCILDWLQQSEKNLTCPQCRAKVTAKPAPAYLLREMVEIFVKREEVRNTSTGGELRKMQKEAQQAVERDRATVRGLFHGRFEPKTGRVLIGIVDEEDDGVLRCPECMWEVHGGHCENPQHGVRVRDPDGDDFFSDSDEGDFSDESEREYEARQRPERWPDSAMDDDIEEGDSEEVDSEEEEEREQAELDRQAAWGRHGGRVYGRNYNPDYEQARIEGVVQQEIDLLARNRGNRPRSVSEDSWAGERADDIRRQASNRQNPIVVEDDDDQDDSEIEALPAPPRLHRRRRSLLSETETEDEGSLADFVEHDTPAQRRWAGPRRNDRSSSEPRGLARSRDTPPAGRRRNARPVIIDDEDEQSSFSEASSQPFHPYSDTENEDDHQALLGYQALSNQTASESEDNFGGPAPRGPGRRNVGFRRSNSVFSVPEEDESTDYGDADDSEDEDGDVRMSEERRPSTHSGVVSRRPAPVIDLSSHDSASEDSEPVTRRRRPTAGRSNTANAAPGRRLARGQNPNNRLSQLIDPNIQNLFAQHQQNSQNLQDNELDFLAQRGTQSVSPGPDRSRTPVARDRTPTGHDTDRSRSERSPTAASTTSTQGSANSRTPQWSPLRARSERSPTAESTTSSQASANRASQWSRSERSPTAASTTSTQGSANRTPQWSPPHQPFASLPSVIPDTSPAQLTPNFRNARAGMMRPASPRVSSPRIPSSPSPVVRRVGSRSSRNHLRAASASSNNTPSPSASLSPPPNIASRIGNGQRLTMQDVYERGMTRRQALLQQQEPTVSRRSSRRAMNAANSSAVRAAAPQPVQQAGAGVGRAARGNRLAAQIGEGEASGGAMLVIGSED